MIPEKLHLVRAGRSPQPMTLKLVLAALAISTLAAPQAHAQFDTGGYTSTSTPQARAQQSQQEKAHQKAEGVITPDEPAGPIPELQVFAAVSLAETYSSNSSGTVGGGYDFYTQPGLHLSAVEQSRRLTALLNYSLTGQYHARNHDLDQLINQLNAMANAELIEQTLFMDVQADARPLSLTRVGALTAEDGTPTSNNYRNSYSYAIRPTLMHQFGNAVETDLWFSQSGVFFAKPSGRNTVPLPGFYVPPTNSNTSQIGARIASLSDFTRLRWSLNASASDTYQTAHQSQKVRSASANLSYSLTNDFSLIGTGGYQIYHASTLLTKDLDGPILLGGFQFVPSPNFSFYVQGGKQNNFPTYIGQLIWSVTPLTQVTASATDKVQTPQQELTSNLQNSGGVPGTGTGTGGNPTTNPTGGSGFLSDGLAINNAIYRNRNLQAMISHSLPRTTYTFALFATIRDRLDATLLPSFLNKREENYGLRFGVSHRLRRDLYGNVALSASRANEFNGHDRILEGDAGIHYDASQTLSVYLNTSIINRESSSLVGFTNGNLNDVRVTVGVNKAF